MSELFRELGPILTARAARQISDPPSEPHPDAQRAELALMRRLYNERYIFQPGDEVRWKHGMGMISKQDRENLVFIFWRPLNTELLVDRRRIEEMNLSQRHWLADPDCLIAFLQDGDIGFEIADSAMLESVT